MTLVESPAVPPTLLNRPHDWHMRSCIHLWPPDIIQSV
jgi:hypothetical protein